MQVEFSVQSVRECKGAALAVLVLLSLVELPVSQEWLERNSGYTDKPVSQALAYLAETGRVARSRSGWRLADGVQLMLGKLEQIEDLSRNYSDSRKNSDSGPIIIINQDSIKKEDEGNKNNTQSRKNSDLPIWNELSVVGVYRNPRTEKMIELPHVTVEYVRALAAQLKAEGKGGCQWAGLFVRLCERGEKVKAKKDPIDEFLGKGRG